MPEEFGPALEAAEPQWQTLSDALLSIKTGPAPDVLLILLRSEEEVVAAADAIGRLGRVDETLLWLCYPQISSRRYQGTISRDHGWDAVIDLGWEGVRQVAIDEGWSALRFRPREATRSYTRKKQIGRGYHPRNSDRPPTG